MLYASSCRPVVSFAPSPLGGEGRGEGGLRPVSVIRLTPIAKRLRRNQTDAEKLLWSRLRGKQMSGRKFKRQAPIDRYVVDFLCAESRLVIELDGGQHATMQQADRLRSEASAAMGYLVCRYWNHDVLRNIEGVLSDIASTLQQLPFDPPHPNPLPDGERE